MLLQIIEMTIGITISQLLVLVSLGRLSARVGLLCLKFQCRVRLYKDYHYTLVFIFTIDDDSSDSLTFFLSSHICFDILLLGESIDYYSSCLVSHLSFRSSNSSAAGTPIYITPAVY